MARIAEGWKIRRPAGRTVYKVRFTVRDKRYDLSTGKRDRVEAAHEAERLYALAVEGRLDGQLPPPGTASLRPLAGPLSEWLASLVTTHDESTRETYAQYGLRWCRRWPTLAEVTRGAVADYARERLGQVARGSVQKEMSALRGLLLWAEEHALIPQAPPPVVLPDRATGTRATTRHEGTTDLTPEQVSAILLRLPEWSSDKAGRWRVRDYFILMAETDLDDADLDDPLALVLVAAWARVQLADGEALTVRQLGALAGLDASVIRKMNKDGEITLTGIRPCVADAAEARRWLGARGVKGL
jgi:hypothetical protein